MTSRIRTVLLSTLAVAIFAHTAVAADPPIVWNVTEDIVTPESAYVDVENGYLYLSQIGEGGPDGKDGDGWISKLTLDGKFVEKVWATGFNAPKGLRSHDGTLWVSDIDRLLAVDMAEGNITQEISIQNAQFLNDVAVGPDGTVYVSDMVASVIYAVKDGAATVFAQGEEIEHPNGLLVDGDSLIVGGWGTPMKEDRSVGRPGRLLKINLQSRKLQPITPEPTGNLDGIESDGSGGYYVTDFVAGKVLHIAADGTTQTVMTLPQGTADLAYVPQHELLILPQMRENKLTAFDMRAEK